jgi:hypothetical protein
VTHPDAGTGRLYDLGVTSPDIAAQRVVAAVEAEDPVAYAAAGQDLVDALPAAGPDDIQPALARLVPVLSGISLERGSGLARVVGGMAWQVVDTSSALGVLVNRACEAMEGAARFLALHRELLGDPPAPQNASAVRETIDRFAAAAAASATEPRKLALAWFTAPDWVQPVLYLSQRADVRAALPQRERLLAAVESIRENLGVANWLYGLLLVLDDAPLIVLHRQSGLGYRVTIGGIGNNAQLQTLIAARLIGEPEAGWLPGTPPSPDMTAAADGSGPMQPPGGIVPQFSLADLQGARLPAAGRPADIPVLQGERVIVLDPPSGEAWGPGRVYALMQPSLRAERQLTPEEAAAWLAKAQPARALSDDQLAWTDDMTIRLPPGRTPGELVDLVLQAALRGSAAQEIELSLAREFALNEDDARLARDRTFGGLVRAATRNPANRPAPDKDPIAFESFQRGEADRSLIARIYPQFA